jgi:transposase
MTDQKTAPKSRGRKPDANSTSGKIRELLKTDMAVADIAKKLGCSTALVYNVKARAAGGGKKRGPGRPPKAKTSAPASMDGLAGILSAVKTADVERAQLRAALEKIQSIVSELLR